MGMMWWLDDSNRTVEEKLGGAKVYYTNKTGIVPNLCLVDPGWIKEEREIAGMRVVPDRRVLRNTLWMGREAPPPTPPQMPAENAGHLERGAV